MPGAPTPRRILSVQPVADGGGSEQALIRMLSELGRDGWECHVAIPEHPLLAGAYEAAGIRIHTVAMERLTTTAGYSHWARYAGRWPVSVLALARLARRIDADVIHSNSLHSWYGWAAAGLIRRPHVWHAREIVFQSTAALATERFLTAHGADLVIAVSEAVARQLPAAHVKVVTDEADPVRFEPERAGGFRKRHGIGDEVPLVGSVARLDTWKGFDVLLDAYPSMREMRPDVELAIAGRAVPGKERYAADLEERARRLGVHWIGGGADVAEMMADLDVFVQVSTEPEPFGLVIVEALASGAPVVAGAEGGPLEILGPAAVDGPTKAGQLVPPGRPELLAAAATGLIPPGPSSLQRRRGRPRLRQPGPDRFAPAFESVLATWDHPGRANRRG